MPADPVPFPHRRPRTIEIHHRLEGSQLTFRNQNGFEVSLWFNMMKSRSLTGTLRSLSLGSAGSAVRRIFISWMALDLACFSGFFEFVAGLLFCRFSKTFAAFAFALEPVGSSEVAGLAH